MRTLVPAALALLLAGTSACSTEASPGVTEAAAPSASAAASTEAPREGPDGAGCRTVAGPRVAREYSGGVYRLVPEHTVPVRTQALGPGCLVVLYRDFTGPMLEPGEPWPYAYAFLVTDAAGERLAELEITVEPAAAVVTAVATGSFNGDDETDIVAVHDDGPALVWLSTDPGQWAQDLPTPGVAGIGAQTVAAARAYYRDLLATPISP